MVKSRYETRQKQLKEQVHNLGLSNSYMRYMQLFTYVGNSVCNLYDKEDIVCPPSLMKGLFTASMVDNVDHNPSSYKAKDSFH